MSTPLQNIISYAKDSFESYHYEEDVSEEAMVLLAIIQCKNMNKVNQDKVSTENISYEFNLDKPYSDSWKSERVGRIVKRMGFTPCRMNTGKSGWKLDLDKLYRLMKRYRVDRDKLVTSQVKLGGK
jgi:hypothetical protein